MSFADSFWSDDYHLGHKVLFGELYEGVKENDDFIALITSRMELELSYGRDLESLGSVVKKQSKRHADPDYVSTVKNAYEELNANFGRQGLVHVEIAINIDDLVLQPFSQWCKEHEQRVAYLELMISDKFKTYLNAKAALEKLLKKYFNKCRMVEEFKSRYSEDELNDYDTLFAEETTDAKADTSLTADDLDDTPAYEIGGSQYTAKMTKELLSQILTHIELKSHKVPILGTYHNVSSGSSITQWFLDNLPELKGNIAKAEGLGQDLVNNGFLKLIGSMSGSKNFINSSQFWYQWKPLVFEITQLSEFDLGKSAQNANYDPIAALGSRTNQFSTYLEDMKQAIGVTSVDYSDKSQYSKLVKEVTLLDSQYFETTKTLDLIRCEFEETVMDHLAFMQKCELDRLKAIKKATFDFIATFANKIATLKNSSDELLLIEETINPVGDLKFLIENYATGKFHPHVTLYDNYYNSNIKQTFGVDLNVKSRLDRRPVPILVQTALSFLDSVYPELADDEERVELWTAPVHLSKIHQVRLQLNELTSGTEMQDVFKKVEPKLVANALKLYFMELPDSIVPHTYYDLIKTLYQTYPAEANDVTADKSRINGLQNTLLELPVCNLATLDAILTHLTRLIQIISSKNADLSNSFSSRLCREFGALVLRPKSDYVDAEGKNAHSLSVAMEILQQNFIADLFSHKEAIFGELRRRVSKKPSRNNSRSQTRGEALRSNSTKSEAGTSISKGRLETKMKKAINDSKGSKKSETKSDNDEALPDAPATPTSKSRSSSPLKSASPSTSGSLKRSLSPNKKKISSLLEKSNSSGSIVSSRPPKKEVIYSESGDSDFAKPQFAAGIERRSSVKDLASKFESTSVSSQDDAVAAD